MSNVLKHRFVSPKLDGPDTTQVQPSAWNDGHAFAGGAAGDVLTRDPADTSFGAAWRSPQLAVFAPPCIGSHADLPQITTGQQDNLDPGAGASAMLWFITATADCYLTGIKAPPPANNGELHLLVNVAGPRITLAHLFGSTPANQFIGASYANTDLTSWRALWLVYSAAFAKWLVIKEPAL